MSSPHETARFARTSAGTPNSSTSDALDHAGKKRIVMVAAVADNGVIGRDGDIPWHLPADLRHFRAVTTGNTVVMGRRTYESIGHPLPHRTNVVVTRRPDWAADGVVVVHSVEEAVARAQDFTGDVMVIGGGEIYAAALPLADGQILTYVHASPEGDTRYPDLDRSEWTEVKQQPGDGYDVVWLERRERAGERARVR